MQETSAGGHAIHNLSVGEACLCFATVGGSNMFVGSAMYRNSSDPLSVVNVVDKATTGYCTFRVSGNSFVCDTTYAARVIFVVFRS